MLLCLLVSVVDHTIIFVLSTAVVCLEEGVFLSKAMVVEKVMQLTYYCIGALAAIPGFVCQEIHLPRYCFTVDPKHCAFTWSKKVNRPRLQRV